MSALRWTGKGLQLLGRILAAEEFEKWVTAEGEKVITAMIEKETLKQFGGRARAKRQLWKDAETALNSETFRSALKAEIEVLPSTLAGLARSLKKDGPKSLWLSPKSFSLYDELVIAVPRTLVRHIYSSGLIEALKDSAELSRFMGFPTIYLQERAYESEDSFFALVEKERGYVCGNGVILGVDRNFSWRLGGMRGHYYFAVGVHGDLSKGSERKNFVAKMQPLQLQLTTSLGAITAKELDAVAQQLRDQWGIR
jgi:hypothetical protein